MWKIFIRIRIQFEQNIRFIEINVFSNYAFDLLFDLLIFKTKQSINEGWRASVCNLCEKNIIVTGTDR